MMPRVLLAVSTALAFAIGAFAGCFQQLDSGAATGPGMGADDGGNADALTNWQLCQSPSCDLPNGDIPFLNQTPPIYLPDGSTTTNPCAEVEQASMTIRQTYCVPCHEGSSAQGNLGFILDDNELATAVSQSGTTDGGPARLIVPGAPLQSLLYVNVAQGLGKSATGMPPPTTTLRPSASDLSVLYAWITACFSGTDAGAYELGPGDYPVEGGAVLSTAPDAGVDASVD
jgi:hypothetical protein